MEKLYNSSHSKLNGSVRLPEFSREIQLGVKVLTEAEEFDKLKEGWTNLVDAAETTIFQTYEWNRTWWKYYGEKGQLHLVIFYHEEKLVGIAPFFKDCISLFGILKYCSLRFLGSDVSQPEDGDLLGLISYTDYLDFIVQPGFEEAVYSAMLNYFHTCDINYDEVLLDVVPQHSTVWNFLIPKLSANEISFLIEDCLSSQLITLEGSWQDYLKTVSKNSRSHMRRALKKIHNPEKKIFNEFEVDNEELVLHYFERLVELHQTRWNRIGSLGTFAEKKNYEFHREVTQLFFKKGWLQMNVLEPADNSKKSIAIDLNYRFKGRLYGVHSSLDIDSKYYSDGPGSVLLNSTLKGVAENPNLNTYDFMRGGEGYKLKLSNKTSLNRRLILMNVHQNRNITANVAKQYAIFRRYLYREWRQCRIFFESKSFPKAFVDYTQFQFNRLKNKIKVR